MLIKYRAKIQYFEFLYPPIDEPYSYSVPLCTTPCYRGFGYWAFSPSLWCCKYV